MKQEDMVLFLLGKMDSLRFPAYVLINHGIEQYPYEKSYIEELLAIRKTLLSSYDDSVKEEKPGE